MITIRINNLVAIIIDKHHDGKKHTQVNHKQGKTVINIINNKVINKNITEISNETIVRQNISQSNATTQAPHIPNASDTIHFLKPNNNTLTAGEDDTEAPAAKLSDNDPQRVVNYDKLKHCNPDTAMRANNQGDLTNFNCGHVSIQRKSNIQTIHINSRRECNHRDSKGD